MCICERVLEKVANSNGNLELQNQFKDESCLCRAEGSGRPVNVDEKVGWVRHKPLHNEHL